MRFESRDIESYAEPVLANELRAGEVYFAVNFGDQQLLIPFVEPKVFIGRNLDEGDTDLLFFQSFRDLRRGYSLQP